MRYSKGQGALSNRDSRFAGTYSEFDHDTQLDTVATEIIAERAKSIISSNRSPDIPFEQSINPYRGCEHGCIYCYQITHKTQPRYRVLTAISINDLQSCQCQKTPEEQSFSMLW